MASTQSPSKIPAHLAPFVVEQHYDHYTPIDQAVWRYVMRGLVSDLADRAHPIYLKGLAEVGISVEAIPDVAHMNACLARVGWGAVTISGVIPTGVFLDFQAHGLLPVSADIRRLEHLAYTPAPDILHETAGHAPIIADERYAVFLKRFGELGARAFSSKEDHALYEATRTLSIVKEDKAATRERIAEAEAALVAAQEAMLTPSEATQVGRLYWWTVEYGLIGDLAAPKIYGAGLLSSMGESHMCLTPAIEKRPFDLEDCLATAFDITTYQPQLFVAESFDQLLEAVETLKGRMAWVRGGTEGLLTALNAGHTGTFELSSGLQVSGTVTEVLQDDAGTAVYVRTAGPTALAADDTELPGHGIATHAEGFGTPIGLLAGAPGPLETYSDAELAAAGLVVGRRATLRFASGVLVEGVVTALVRHSGKLVVVSFTECRVTLGDRVLFDPAWGAFDMAVGATVTSVYAGAADKARFYGHHYQPSATGLPQHAPDVAEQRLQSLYGELRVLREAPQAPADLADRVEAVVRVLDADYPTDWLARLEAYELLTTRQRAPELAASLRATLDALKADPALRELIDNGLALLGVDTLHG
jgi:phenylalanine-4-hydroxylase